MKLMSMDLGPGCFVRLPDSDVDHVSIAAACATWATWSLDVPPTGPTGDRVADRRLADAFRQLIKCGSNDARLQWVEQAVFSANDFPPPNQPSDTVRETLIRWWLDLQREGEAQPISPA